MIWNPKTASWTGWSDRQTRCTRTRQWRRIRSNVWYVIAPIGNLFWNVSSTLPTSLKKARGRLFRGQKQFLQPLPCFPPKDILVFFIMELGKMINNLTLISIDFYLTNFYMIFPQCLKYFASENRNIWSRLCTCTHALAVSGGAPGQFSIFEVIDNAL